MRDVAEQQGIPQFLVQLRHQAVHEAHNMNFRVIGTAIKRLQAFLFTSYWYPILARLIKRSEQINALRDQMSRFKLNCPGASTHVPNFDRLLEEARAKHPSKSEKHVRSEMKSILNRYTKNNIKLTVPLDMNQIVDVIKVFVDCSLVKIDVTFKNLKLLSDQVTNFIRNHSSDQVESEGDSDSSEPSARSKLNLDLMSMVEVQMKNNKNVFICMLNALQKRSGDQLIPSLIFQRCIHLMTKQIG
mmetsp:Transcript_17866/g.30343  ORF Transcript_17866/g.30343 Transcript_17866/m.30343 type:complete len:244 (+) Transcript_17866:500-1231(+)